MTCREFVELIRARLDKELELNDSQRFDQHASACRKCAAYLDDYRRTIATTTKAFNSQDGCDEDAELPEALVQQIINAGRRFSTRRRTSEH